jgi:short-subunit dehydrogenase
MAVSFRGTVNRVEAFLPGLLTRPDAAVVNVSSMAALVPVPGQSAHGASKAAVKLFTEGLQVKLRKTSVAVSVVLPGGVDTDITARLMGRLMR